MSTFTWRDTLTVSVGEMNRTQALDCARQFDMLAKVYTSYDELMREADVITVVNAPAVVRIKDDVQGPGTHTIEIEGKSPFTLTLPLNRDAFYALPMSLSEAWVNAAVVENEWFVNTLKKVFSLTSPTNEQKSGVELSSEPSLTT